MTELTTACVADDASVVPAASVAHAPALLCFSHLRWDFVCQRPQHLMTRFARVRDVWYIEEPVFDDVPAASLRITPRDDGLRIAVPVLPHGLTADAQAAAQRALLDALLRDERIAAYDAWYYTPMALAFSAHLVPSLVVYDCMDELSQFDGAPPEMVAREAALIARADVVFTGGRSLYEAKRHRHDDIHSFPSSVDQAHFRQARRAQPAPHDQPDDGRVRLGFFGVIDERFDTALVADVAARRPDWQIVLIGPVVKIDPATLPRADNIAYLGMKSYADLPAYLAGWTVAIMPFARNAATRFISPTKTPEYLAGGRPVVSTSIRDVVHPYGDEGLVGIADSPDAFVAACEHAIAQRNDAWLARVDAFLARMSWDATWDAMARVMASARDARRADAPSPTPAVSA